MHSENDPNRPNLPFERNRQKLTLRIKSLELSIVEGNKKNDLLKTQLANTIQQNQCACHGKKQQRDLIQAHVKKLTPEIKQLSEILKRLEDEQMNIVRQSEGIEEELQRQDDQRSKLIEEKANKYASMEAMRRKVRAVEEQTRKAKLEINRLNIELGMELSATSRHKHKTFQSRNEQHKRIEQSLSSIQSRLAVGQQKLEQLNSINRKLTEQMKQKSKEVIDLRKRNQDMEQQSIQLEEIRKKLSIERQLLNNFHKENALLRQKLQKLTGQNYLTEHLAVVDRGAGLAYRSASQGQLQRLLEQKLDIIYNQKDELQRLAQEIDSIALAIKQCDIKLAGKEY